MTGSDDPTVRLTFDPQLRGQATVKVKGDFDASLAGEFREVAGRLDEATGVVVDLVDVPFMDSSGLGALMALLRVLIGREAKVRVICRPGPVRRLLHVTGVDRLTVVFEDATELDG